MICHFSVGDRVGDRQRDRAVVERPARVRREEHLLVADEVGDLVEREVAPAGVVELKAVDVAGAADRDGLRRRVDRGAAGRDDLHGAGRRQARQAERQRGARRLDRRVGDLGEVVADADLRPRAEAVAGEADRRAGLQPRRDGAGERRRVERRGRGRVARASARSCASARSARVAVTVDREAGGDVLRAAPQAQRRLGDRARRSARSSRSGGTRRSRPPAAARPRGSRSCLASRRRSRAGRAGRRRRARSAGSGTGPGLAWESSNCVRTVTGTASVRGPGRTSAFGGLGSAVTVTSCGTKNCGAVSVAVRRMTVGVLRARAPGSGTNCGADAGGQAGRRERRAARWSR